MLNRDDLASLLRRVAAPRPASFFESQNLDFKQAQPQLKATLKILADAAVCFANADGGTIVFGVNDKATTRGQAFVGAPADYTIDMVRRGIFDRTVPNLTTVAWE